MIWQPTDRAESMVGRLGTEDPCAVERVMLAEFVAMYGRAVHESLRLRAG